MAYSIERTIKIVNKATNEKVEVTNCEDDPELMEIICYDEDGKRGNSLIFTPDIALSLIDALQEWLGKN
jgi:hypothetical protein